MAKLINLKLDEFSIVAGPDVQPANPEAKAWLYKATSTKETEDEMKVQKTAAPAGGGSNAPTQPGNLAAVIAKGVGDIVKNWKRTSTYSSTSTENVEEDPPVQQATSGGDGSTTVVIMDSVAKAAAATSSSDLESVVSTAMKAVVQPVTDMIIGLDGRLKTIEKSSLGSRSIPKNASAAGFEIKDNASRGFGEFAKFLVEKSGLTPGQKLSKATISSSGWTYGLSSHESMRFIDYIFELSVLLKKIRTVQMPDKKFNIDKIDLGGKVFRKGTPGTDPGDTVSVNNPTQITLDAKEVVAIVSIGDDTVEDNIEGEAFVDHLLKMIATAGANELEQAAIHADTAVADANGILDIWDGFYKLGKAGGQVTEAMADTNRLWPGTNGAKATKLIKKIPVKYRQDFRNLAVLLANDLYLDYTDELASKGYSEAWTAITGMNDVPIRSIPNIRLPLLRTDMSFTYSATPYTNGTFVMITDLRNLIMGIHREITIEPFRQPRKRCTDYVISMRGDVKIENAEAIGIYDHALVA
jgi:hypothetical protein